MDNASNHRLNYPLIVLKGLRVFIPLALLSFVFGLLFQATHAARVSTLEISGPISFYWWSETVSLYAFFFAIFTMVGGVLGGLISACLEYDAQEDAK